MYPNKRERLKGATYSFVAVYDCFRDHLNLYLAITLFQLNSLRFQDPENSSVVTAAASLRGCAAATGVRRVDGSSAATVTAVAVVMTAMTAAI